MKYLSVIKMVFILTKFMVATLLNKKETGESPKISLSLWVNIEIKIKAALN